MHLNSLIVAALLTASLVAAGPVAEPPTPALSPVAEAEAFAAAVASTPVEALPTLADPTLKRLLSPASLTLPEDPGAALEAMARLGEANTAALRVYLAAMLQGRPVDAEVLAFMGFLLRWTVAQWSALDALVASQAPGFLDDPVRAQGLRTTSSGTSTTLAGALTTLEGHAQWVPGPMVEFAGVVAQVLPALLIRLGEAERAAVQARVDRLVASLPDGELRGALAPAASR